MATGTPDPIEAVFATPELCGLIAERAFDPVRSFTVRADSDSRPAAWFDLATLASLARVNRALARVPWPAAAGMAHAALGHEEEMTRFWLVSKVIKGRSPAAGAKRAMVKTKLEAGLRVVFDACVALDDELGGPEHRRKGAPLARTPGSAAERAYRAYLLYSAVDALWRRDSRPSILPEPSVVLARALCDLGTNERLPVELRAAALSTLVAVMARQARAADPQCALRRAYSRSYLKKLLRASQLERLDRAGAELVIVCRWLDDAINKELVGSSVAWWLGPLGLALVRLLNDDACTRVIQHGFENERDGLRHAALPSCSPPAMVSRAYPLLCRLFVDDDAPVVVRGCAAAALEKLAQWLDLELDEEELEDDWDSDSQGESGLSTLYNLLVVELDESGATERCRTLSAELELSRAVATGGHASRPRPSAYLAMPVSRSNLLGTARRLLRIANVHHMQGVPCDDDVSRTYPPSTYVGGLSFIISHDRTSSY